jgi:exo-beta-1,3-glucanase (GH17 family)
MNNIFFNEIKKFHPEKTLVLGEIGWATNYDSSRNGEGQQGSLIKGEVGYAAQEKFLINLSEWIDRNKVTTFLFEAFDEPWKGGGAESSPNEIEKHWGVFYENRTPKESFKNYLKANKTEKEKY